MTVSTKTPLVEYTGNGTTSRFDWDWEMIEDSAIEVLIDNERITAWVLEGQSVVFDTAPGDGAFIQIYRRTKVWMPEDYVAFGRFHPDKTELSVDRATMIAAEYEAGIVGRANLTTTHNEFYVTVHSERGTDAHVPMYAPDDTPPPTPVDPDPSIVWADVDLNTIGEGANGLSATISFIMDGTASYPVNNVLQAISWVDVDPADGDYWMRVTKINSNRPVLINDGVSPRELGEAFPIATGPYISIDTFGETPPQVATASIIVEICKDDGGLPDGGWVSRTVDMEVRFNLQGEVEPPPPAPTDPPDLAGAISWDAFFGAAFGSRNLFDVYQVIAAEGVAIWFTVPITTDRVKVKITTIEVAGLGSMTLRTGAVNTTVLDFVTPPTFVWGLGGGITLWINPDGGDVGTEIIQGQTYILNLKNNTPPSPNWIHPQVSYQVQ